MGVLGNTVGNAINAYTGNSSGTNLESFLSKFSNSKGRYVDTIDPLGTFDVKFKFYPTVKAVAAVDKWTKVGQSLVNSAVSMGENLLDNATGGLYSSLTEGGAGSVMKAHDDYKDVWQHS